MPGTVGTDPRTDLVEDPLRALILPAAAVLLVLGACTSSDPQPDNPAPEETAAVDDPSDPGGTPEGELRFLGPDADALLNAEQAAALHVEVEADHPGQLEDLVVLLDGQPVVDGIEVDGTRLRYTPGDLPDGPRTLAVTAGEDGALLHAWDFEVKATPPPLELDEPLGPAVADQPVTVSGATEPGATVAVGATQVTADEQGSFTLVLDTATPTLTVVATDVAGNAEQVERELVVVPSRVEVDELRTVHVTFWAWASPQLREPIIELIERGAINAVQLDLKDEGGQIGYPSQVELAEQIGATTTAIDLDAAVAELHELGVAVVGRIVAFADPQLAAWAWEAGEREMVIQLTDGSDYFRGSYAGFSNYVHPEVIAYNLDLAEEAAAAGVDHILWDYIRRPEGQSSYTVPGLETSPEAAIVDFTRQADERLAPYGVQHGASVYGIAADRPEQIGQDIPAMAEHLDYVAPMIYPSHWGPGEYGVADPNRQPYDIVRATLEVWQEAVADRRARVVPWLEDTSYRAWDRPHQIREQWRGALDQGIDEWLMWNPGSSYTTSVYEPRG